MTLAAQLAQELQHWQPFDLVTVGTLAVLEGILSVDNALVLAILVRDLPAERRRKALTYGIAGAFVFRFVVLGSSLVLRDHRQRAERSRFFDRLQERLERGEIGVEEILSQETVPGEILTDLQERGWLSVRDRAPDTKADGSR